MDRLLVSYHDTPDAKAPYGEFDPPDNDWKTLYEQAGQRFPGLGLYPTADPTEPESGALMMGDAIDDIADITADLQTVVWYADHHGAAYADAYFRDFHFHWGQHARELLVLLHALAHR